MLFLLALSSAAHVSISVDETTGTYTVNVDSVAWYNSAPTSVCERGKRVVLHALGLATTSGSDAFGNWSGVAVKLGAAGEHKATTTFRQYARIPNVAVASMEIPRLLNTSGCGTNKELSTHFPAFNTSAARAKSLHTLSWRDQVLSTTASATGLRALGATGLDCGPVVSTDPDTGRTLVWSSLSSHKILPQQTAGDVYAMGLSASIPSIPAGFSYAAVFVVGDAPGATAGMYEWGRRMRAYYNTTRLPSVTLTDVGYYTDDGAYYYVWESFGIPARPWPAEEGLVKVKEDLHARGVPIGYMQLDDWWYTGPFYSFRPGEISNVKAVVEWSASNASRLFPHGLSAFSHALGLPLQLYTPFWSVEYQSKYRMVDSTVFERTKLVTPNDSYPFFAELFDQGKAMTNGRFATYEIDFLDSNFQGCAEMTADVGAADRWYSGMARAAAERRISIQYCLPSATDMLVSLGLPSVVQARASTDYVDPVGNAAELGGSSLLMGAVGIAPSKDTLWTRSPQPATWSDTKQHGEYTSQPHVALDAVLATLSLGPVGISDALGETDVELISQAYRCARDGTLLRPSRPLSLVDSAFANRSAGVPSADVRGTHATVGGGHTSYYVVAWRTGVPVTLRPTDLYPAPQPRGRLAVREHVLRGGSAAQHHGCEDGQPAVPTCVHMLAAGAPLTLRPTGAALSNFSLTAIHPAVGGGVRGAFFLGELSKFVHVSPLRFESVAEEADPAADGVGPCALAVVVRGAPGEEVRLVCIDAGGITRVATAKIPAAGRAKVRL